MTSAAARPAIRRCIALLAPLPSCSKPQHANTVVSGPPLELPDHVRHVRRDGLSIALYRDASHGGHDVAIFERNGRTCVLAGHVMRVSTLVKLAAWKGEGEVRS